MLPAFEAAPLPECLRFVYDYGIPARVGHRELFSEQDERWLHSLMNQVNWVGGHYKANVHELGYKPGGFTYVTVMREPVARAVSSWNWAVGEDGGRRHELVNSGIDFLEWVTSDDAWLGFMASNHQTRVYCGRTFWGDWERDAQEHELRKNREIEPLTERHLECAKRNLAENFGLVLILEDNTPELFDWLQPALNRLLGFPAHHLVGMKHKIRQNQTPPDTSDRQVHLETLTAEQRRAVEAANRLDLELYEYAKEVNRAQLAALKAWWDEEGPRAEAELAQRKKADYCCSWGRS